MENEKHPVVVWLKKNSRSQQWLARQLGVTQKSISENINRRVTVMQRTKLAVQAVTNGDVMADEWPK